MLEGTHDGDVRVMVTLSINNVPAGPEQWLQMAIGDAKMYDMLGEDAMNVTDATDATDTTDAFMDFNPSLLNRRRPYS